MRHSEFWNLMRGEFGVTYAASVARSQSMSVLDGRTAEEALEAGVPPRQVWEALCDAMDVPVQRRLGKDAGTRR
ncbi:MAG: histidine kinase [Micrococcales bacterium]|nr:MAG: histidine kinase [Micrococcales bacterium]